MQGSDAKRASSRDVAIAAALSLTPRGRNSRHLAVADVAKGEYLW